MDIPFGYVDWVDTLWFDRDYKLALITDIGEFWHCTMKLDGKDYAILDRSAVKRGWIQYDVENGEGLKDRCVVVGKTSVYKGSSVFPVSECYMLVVRPTGVDAEYKRVGVGVIQMEYIVRRRINVRLV